MVLPPLPVLTVCQPTEKGVLAWTMYVVTGLWLSGPEPQDRCTVVSVMSVTTRPSGAPGGPETPTNEVRHVHHRHRTTASTTGELTADSNLTTGVK